MEQKVFYDNKLGYEVAIIEMRRQLEEQGKSITAVKNIVENVFAASSLIIILSGALGILGATVSPNYFVLYNFLVVLAVSLYILLIILSIWILQPTEIHGPIKPDWKVLYDYYINFPNEKAVLRQQLSSYLNAVHVNEKIIFLRRKRAQYTSSILPAIVVILFLLSVIKN